MMKSFLALTALLAASPALAQTDPRLLAREQELMAQQQNLQQRSIALENQLNALDARVRTEQGLSDLRAQQLAPTTRIPSDPSRPQAAVSGSFASIPDASLSESNRRVREASGNRR